MAVKWQHRGFEAGKKPDEDKGAVSEVWKTPTVKEPF